MSKKPLGLYMSVFNCHLNNAKDRAIEAFKEEYGEEVFSAQIQPFLASGIMGIFNVDPNQYTKFFAGKITEFVNEKSDKDVDLREVKGAEYYSLTVQALRMRNEVFKGGGMSRDEFEITYLNGIGDFERSVARAERIEL